MADGEARDSRENFMTYGNSITLFNLHAVIHRDLKDWIVFLDPCSRCFRGVIGRIRAFRLPIHLEAKAAAVRLLALRDRLRDGFLRRGWHGYGLGPLSGRRCHLMISFKSVQYRNAAAGDG